MGQLQYKQTVDETLNAEVRVNTVWSEERTLATVEAAMKRYPLETTRIYAKLNRKEHGTRVEKRTPRHSLSFMIW